MSDIKKLDLINSPIRKFDLAKSKESNLILLDLRSVLKIALRSDIKDQSLSRLKAKNRLFGSSRAAFLVGSAATLVVTVVILGQLASTDQNPSIGAIIIWTSIFSVTYWGYSTLKTMGREKFEPLHSNGQPIFKTVDMKDRWRSFYDWAKENRIPLFMTEKGGDLHVMGSDFWKINQNELFILGDNSHRKELLKDERQLTSQLQIQKSDWEAYLEFSKELEQKLRDQEKVSKLSTKQTSSGLSVRQKLFGPETKESPRFKMMVSNPEFGNRYYKLGIKRSDLSSANKPCHAAITLILEGRNTSIFEKIAKNTGKPQNDEDSEFLEKLDFALEVVKNKNHSRRDQILKFKWLKLEQYLEGLNIISDEEVVSFCKEFYPDSDSSVI